MILALLDLVIDPLNVLRIARPARWSDSRYADKRGRGERCGGGQAGERIPLDGEVVNGIASVDESSFTGESVPAIKTYGDTVSGGSLNLEGLLHVRVTKVGQ